jgi:hypothetical protein
MRRRGGRADLLYHLQIGSIPRNRNMRTPLRKIIEYQPCAAALQQAARDKDPKPHVIRCTGARRDVRLTEPSDKVKRKPWAIISDLDSYRLLVPERRDADLAFSTNAEIGNRV